MNEFGHKDGFTDLFNFLEKLANGQIAITAKHFEYIVRFMAKTMPFWSREFLCSYISKIRMTIE